LAVLALLAAAGPGCAPSDAPDDSSEINRASEPLIWLEQQKLVASDGSASDALGTSVALSGDTAVVGAPWDSFAPASGQGSAYVFVRGGVAWVEQQRLRASDAAEGSSFGISVALSADTMLVGAFQDDTGPNDRQGSAYVFTRTGSTWTEAQKLLASDGEAGSYFGGSVALAGDTALVGAPGRSGGGAAYVFVRSGSTWTPQQTLVASDVSAGDEFGGSVALGADTALVGAPRDQVGSNAAQGSAYVFVRVGSTWTVQQKLTASDGAAGDTFGSIVLSGDTALIGAPSRTVGTNLTQGSVYVFVRMGSTWTEQQALAASDGASEEYLGRSLALSGDTALAGVAERDVGTNQRQGSAYVFSRSGSTWVEQQKLFASDGQADDNFGASVALSGAMALVGASNDGVGSNAAQGSAYVFTFGEENGDLCTSPSACASRHCVDGRCCNSACDGACDACSVAAGAQTNGTCSPVPAGSPGSPVCAAPLGCTGASRDCGACSADAECASEDYCDAVGTCQPSKAQGAACNVAARSDCLVASCRACAAGLTCVDGRCCESACAGKCEACSAALTGAANGTCAAIPADEDPEGDCDADPPASCDRPGVCDGARACRPYTERGAPCGATTCSSGEVSGELCNGSGDCDEDTVPCAPYVCDGTACGTRCTADADCAESAYCNTGGRCTPKLGPGEPCTREAECGSTAPRCADGVCCESRCAGQCEACDLQDSLGSCVPVEGEPRGDREPCGGDGVCAGSCNGSEGAACDYPSESIECASECTDARVTVSRCDGSGVCSADQAVSCGDYGCGADRCLASCETSADCAAGRRCESGSCIPSTAICSDDLSESRPVNADPIPCGAYKCDETTGGCRSTCNTSAACAAGKTCNPSTRACETANTSVAADEGCGCRTLGAANPRGTSSGAPLLGLLFALALALARMRRGLLRKGLRGA
jgi:hypothetical protein